jgi:hypothetical protein
MPPSLLSDEQLFAAFKKGDKRAFEKIYQSYFSDLVFYGFKDRFCLKSDDPISQSKEIHHPSTPQFS